MRVLDAYPVVAEAFCIVREEKGGAELVCDCTLKNHRTAKLNLKIGTDGRLLILCRAGCPTLEILRAARLSWADVFPKPTDWKTVKREVVARYPYHDERGALLYETLRLEPGFGGKDKTFYQRRPLTPNPQRREDWVNKLDDVRRVLYRLPELLAADEDRPVFVVGGEKDADSLRSLELIATTNVCGERSDWLDGYSQTLAGRHVVVIQDRDAVGRRHTNEVCGSLLEYAASVRRTKLPAKDATAFLNELRQQGVQTRADLRADFLAVCGEIKTWVGVG